MKRKTSKFFAALISVIVAVSVLTMTPIGLFLYFQDAAKKMYIRNIRNT